MLRGPVIYWAFNFFVVTAFLKGQLSYHLLYKALATSLIVNRLLKHFGQCH